MKSRGMLTLMMGAVIAAAFPAVAKHRPEAVAAPAQADNDVGCCVLKATPVYCFTTNRAYCRNRANKAKVTFSFHKDKACKDLSECRGSNPADSGGQCERDLPNLEGLDRVPDGAL